MHGINCVIVPQFIYLSKGVSYRFLVWSILLRTSCVFRLFFFFLFLKPIDKNCFSGIHTLEWNYGPVTFQSWGMNLCPPPTTYAPEFLMFSHPPSAFLIWGLSAGGHREPLFPLSQPEPCPFTCSSGPAEEFFCTPVALVEHSEHQGGKEMRQGGFSCVHQNHRVFWASLSCAPPQSAPVSPAVTEIPNSFSHPPTPQ